MPVRCIVSPEREPLTLEEAKMHLRISHSGDEGTIEDDYIYSLIRSVREYCEWTLLGRALITQTLQYRTDRFRPVIRLPMPPLQEIVDSEITYKDRLGDTHVLIEDEDFLVDTAEEPSVVLPAPGKRWPSVRLWPGNPIVITYIAGYGDAASDVPEEVRQWMRLMIGHYYENREAILPLGHNIMRSPYGIDWLLQGYRTFGRADT